MMFDLVKEAEPLEPLRYPTGHVCAVRALDSFEWEMLRELIRTNDSDLAKKLLLAAVPETTNEDLLSLGKGDALKVILYAARKIEAARDEIKNSSGEAATTAPLTSPPSSHDMTLSTS